MIKQMLVGTEHPRWRMNEYDLTLENALKYYQSRYTINTQHITHCHSFCMYGESENKTFYEFVMVNGIVFYSLEDPFDGVGNET